MIKMFNKYNLNYEFVDGIYYTDDIIKNYGLYFYSTGEGAKHNLRQAEMVISLGHHLCARKFLEQKMI